MVLPVLVICASTPLTQRTASCELANHHTNRVFQFNLSLCLLVNVSPLAPGASVHPPVSRPVCMKSLQILSLTMFEKIPLDQLLAQMMSDEIQQVSDTQLILFA